MDVKQNRTLLSSSRWSETASMSQNPDTKANLSVMCSRTFKAILSCLWLLWLACAGTHVDSGPVHWPDYLTQPFPTAKEYPDDGAVVLLQQGSLNIFPDQEIPQSQLEFRCIVKIFDERGYDLANVTIPYSSSTKISDIRARTITADGAVVPVAADKIFDVSIYPAFIFYADTRAKRFTFPAVAPECILEYRYTATVQGYTYWDSWSFQSLVPTRLSRYEVTAPSEWPLKWQCSNIDLAPKTTAVPAGFKQTWLWQAADVPPLLPEPGMPAWRDVQPSLLFAPLGMKTWPDLARWFFGLYKDRVQPTAEIRKRVEQLCPSGLPPLQRLRRLYHFVRDEVRYVAVSIGIGGYQPHPAAEVFLNRYGDCKDKVALLQTMAACAGIEVSPVLISTWQNGVLDTTVVSHTHFNHVIARARLADSSMIWMDPTSRFTPFAELPWFDRDRLVYAVAADGNGEWQRTPGQSAADHQWRRCWHMNLGSENILATLQSDYAGAAAHEMRTLLQDLHRRERIEYLAREIKKSFPAAAIDTATIAALDDDELPLSCSVKFRLPLAAEGAVWSLSQFGAMDVATPLSERRTYPLQFRHPQTVVDSIFITGNGLWQLETDAAEATYEHPCATYRFTCQQPGKEFVLVKRFILHQPFVSHAEYASFYDLLRHMAQTDKSLFFLRPVPGRL